ncbi:asparagine synthase-related protein [Azospirillum sp. Sh1]|uniref:asparagine synthase-related protein n=1 Tax=Azospirillum sp. Sh1 TaxID=2607285 RepID=UPI0011EC3CD8|nr:asparagine synthase-related protein [Azospirillum sp. Sh1]KAA0573388.1 hypothetical protein FZ029_20640 [Azospirillum sp. Sh1]
MTSIPIPNSELKVYRQLLIERIEREDPNRTAELALSGGIDSATLLFAMLESGRRPTCFTFYIDKSPSEDLIASRALCQHFGLTLREVAIPWDMDQLVRDLRRIIPAAHNPRKPTIVQCMHPWLYLYPAMQSDLAFCGLGAEDQFGTQGKLQKFINMTVAAAKRDGKTPAEAREVADKAVWDQGWRGRSWEGDLDHSTANIIRLGRSYGKTLIDLYSGDRRLIEWFGKWSVFDLQKPFPKAASVYAFEDYYRQGAFLRKPSNYQINSKLKDMHEALCNEPRYNKRGAKAVVSIYMDIAKGLL